MTPPSSTRIGTTNPKAWMLSAICRICFFEWVLALRALGLSALSEIHFNINISLYLGTPEASAHALAGVGYRSNCQGDSGSDHIKQIASRSAFARLPSGYQLRRQLAVPGIAEVTSPASITCRPDWQWVHRRASPLVRPRPRKLLIAQNENNVKQNVNTFRAPVENKRNCNVLAQGTCSGAVGVGRQARSQESAESGKAA